MPRLARGLADGTIYHVINRGNCRQDVFHNDADFRAFVDLLGEAKERHLVKLMGYCLMTNHFHLLLSPNVADDLSKFMQWLLTSHVRRHHCHYRTSGHVWQGRYRSFIVEEGGPLLTVVRYIEGNPVRKSLVLSAQDWRWSSHRERINCASQVIDSIPCELPQQWTDRVNSPLMDSEMEILQQCVNRGSPYGSMQWRSAICDELGLQSTIRAKGRPRKWGQEK